MYEKQVSIRFYKELNFFLPKKRKSINFTIDVKGKVAVKDLIESLGIPHVEVDLIVINGESVGFDRAVSHDDYIAVYPVCDMVDPVGSPLHLRPPFFDDIRFVVDVNLGRVARALRMYGYDTVYRNDLEDDEIANIAEAEKRIVLTRDLGVLKYGQVSHGYFVRSTDPETQIDEVFTHFKFIDETQPFSRCMECNCVLSNVEKSEIKDLLPDKVKEVFNEFKRCDSCDRIYWKGSHHERMVSKLIPREKNVNQ